MPQNRAGGRRARNSGLRRARLYRFQKIGATMISSSNQQFGHIRRQAGDH